MPSLADRLASPDPPWVELLVLPPGPAVALPAAPPGFVLRQLHGRRCRTKAAVLAEFARVLEFPAYAGPNWDAFEECLGDLEWLPAAGYILVVTDAEQLLARRPADYVTFVSILESVGRHWARPDPGTPRRVATPFHVLLTVTARLRDRRRDWRVPATGA
jgi:hypothetical protein